MAALWQQRAKLQVGKDKWVDGDLQVMNDRVSFSGPQRVQILVTTITGVFVKPVNDAGDIVHNRTDQCSACLCTF